MRIRRAHATEEWRHVPGWEGLYSVSNLGNVRIEVRRQNIRAGQLLRPSPVRDGYLMALLSRNGTKATTERRMVHRLVSEAFIHDIPMGSVVNHLDGNKQNNRLTNLEICTHQQNVQHSMKVLGNRRDGEHNAAAKLTEAQVLEIRQRAADREKYLHIAPDYGITTVMVGNIATGKAWKEVGGPRMAGQTRLTPEARAEGVRLILAGEATVVQVAKELGVNHAAISYHVKKARAAAR